MDIIKNLITEHGCDPVLQDNDGDMPIHIACRGGQLNVVKYPVMMNHVYLYPIITWTTLSCVRQYI